MTYTELAERTLVQAQGSMVSDMNGEKVMFSVSSGKYYNLGQIGGRIWELLAAPTTLSRIVDRLVQEYDIERAVCEEQVAAFLRNLHEEALIEVGRAEA